MNGKRGPTIMGSVVWKPWHDAKPGEVWVFKVAGLEFAAVVGSEYEVTDIEGKYNLTDFRIESAYKVYPVE